VATPRIKVRLRGDNPAQQAQAVAKALIERFDLYRALGVPAHRVGWKSPELKRNSVLALEELEVGAVGAFRGVLDRLRSEVAGEVGALVDHVEKAMPPPGLTARKIVVRGPTKNYVSTRYVATDDVLADRASRLAHLTVEERAEVERQYDAYSEEMRPRLVTQIEQVAVVNGVINEAAVKRELARFKVAEKNALHSSAKAKDDTPSAARIAIAALGEKLDLVVRYNPPPVVSALKKRGHRLPGDSAPKPPGVPKPPQGPKPPKHVVVLPPSTRKPLAPIFTDAWDPPSASENTVMKHAFAGTLAALTPGSVQYKGARYQAVRDIHGYVIDAVRALGGAVLPRGLDDVVVNDYRHKDWAGYVKGRDMTLFVNAATALGEAVRGVSPTNPDGIRTVVHESVHLSVSMLAYDYRRGGKALEEGLTETLARFLSARAFEAVSGKNLHIPQHTGSYPEYVFATRLLLKYATADSEETAKRQEVEWPMLVREAKVAANWHSGGPAYKRAAAIARDCADAHARRAYGVDRANLVDVTELAQCVLKCAKNSNISVFAHKVEREVGRVTRERGIARVEGA